MALARVMSRLAFFVACVLSCTAALADSARPDLMIMQQKFTSTPPLPHSPSPASPPSHTPSTAPSPPSTPSPPSSPSPTTSTAPPPSSPPPLSTPPPAATPTAPTGSVTKSWCVAKPAADPAALQQALDFACGADTAFCQAIQLGQSCYEPNTLQSHASYAFNAYWQALKAHGGTCNFNGAAILTVSDPSYDACEYPSL